MFRTHKLFLQLPAPSPSTQVRDVQRELIVQVVLGTDMKQHFSTLANFNSKMAAASRGPGLSSTKLEQHGSGSGAGMRAPDSTGRQPGSGGVRHSSPRPSLTPAPSPRLSRASDRRRLPSFRMPTIGDVLDERAVPSGGITDIPPRAALSGGIVGEPIMKAAARRCDALLGPRSPLSLTFLKDISYILLG